MRLTKFAPPIVVLLAASVGMAADGPSGGLRGGNRKVGTAINSVQLASSPEYAAFAAKQYDMVTPEFEMKFATTEPSRGIFDFTKGNVVAQYAKDHGLKVRGHCFAWHHALPDWLTSGKFSASEVTDILKNHIFTVAQHFRDAFPGVVQSWDVVNEAIGDDAKLRKDLPWVKIGQSPSDYVATAFQWAHAADPAARLFYNDYGIEGMNAKSDAVYSLLQHLVKAGIPVQGIGFQSHLSGDHAPDMAGVENNFRRFAALGLEIQITELDVKLQAGTAGPSSDQLAQQAQIYGNMASLCVKLPACSAFVTWGFTDQYSWIPGQNPGWGWALPFDAHYKPKAAFWSLEGVFHSGE